MENASSHQTQDPQPNMTNSPNSSESVKPALRTIEVNERAHEILLKLASDEGIDVANVVDAAINSLNFQVRLIGAMEKEMKQRGIFHKFKAKWKNQLAREAQAEKSKIVQLSREIQLPMETVPSGIVIP